MNLLSKAEIQNLFNQRDKFCFSIYLPTFQAGQETRQNSIRFKNLLDEAESKLMAAGLNTSEADELLKAARTKIEDYNFWQHQAAGLACFITKGETRYYSLPQNFSELVVLSDRFVLKPLLPLFTSDASFYLLALAQNEIRLFQGSKYNIQQLALPEDVPVSLAEALRYDDPEFQLQFHSARSNHNPIYHGQGVGTTDNKDEILRYFQQVDRGLISLLESEQKPLILAGVEFLLPIYQSANSYNGLLSEGVTGNPEHTKPEKLQQQAWQIIQPHFQQAKQQAKEQYQQLLTTKQASANIEQIIPAAYQGQVDTLFVADDFQCWGHFEPETNSINIENTSTSENQDIVDVAAIQTFLQGGMVYLLPQAEIPNGDSLAAIYRYPVYDNAEKNSDVKAIA